MSWTSSRTARLYCALNCATVHFSGMPQAYHGAPPDLQLPVAQGGWISASGSCSIRHMPFNGGGFSGGGFGRTNGGGVGATPATDDPWANAPSGLSQQTTGVAQYGDVWASSNCAPCNTAIQQLQAAIGVHVDGKVGQSTADAVARLGRAAQQYGMTADALQLARVGNSPELVAKNADWLLPIVQRVAAKVNTVNTQTSPTVFPVVTGGAPTPMNPTAPQIPTGAPPGMQVSALPGIFAPGTKWRARLPYIIGGAVLLIGAGVAGLILTAPSRDSDEE